MVRQLQHAGSEVVRQLQHAGSEVVRQLQHAGSEVRNDSSGTARTSPSSSWNASQPGGSFGIAFCGAGSVGRSHTASFV